MSEHRVRILAIAVTILLMVLLTIPLSTGQAQSPTPPAMSAATPAAMMAAPSVTVTDQPLVDNRVIIDRVVSEGPGWLVVHNQKGTTFGDDIGEAALVSGENAHVVVAIKDASKLTGTLYAMLHVDKGVVGAYEFPGPDVPAQVNGGIVSPPFKITSGLPAPAAAPTTAAAAPMAAQAITLQNFAFDPASLTVKVGTTVTWTNKDAAPHTVTSTSGPEAFDSSQMASGKTFSHTFAKAGKYTYHCQIHPSMVGTILVE